MALFRNVNELSRQNLRERPFERTSGIRKFGLSLMGYKDDGTKNLWGKLNPMNIAAPGLSHLYAEGLATGDTKDVLKENRSEAISSQLASLKLASNFIPGVGVAGKFGMNMGFDAANKMNKNEKFDNALKIDEELNGSGSALIEETLRNKPLDDAKDAINTDVANSTIMDDADVFDENSYIKGIDAENSSGTANALGTNASKMSNVLGTVNTALDVGSDVAGVVATQNQYNKGLKSTKKKLIRSKQNKNTTFNYL